MSLSLRKLLFWPHLIAGVLAGLVIALMSLTGVALALETPVLAWADRDARRVEAPAPDAPRLPLDELLARVRAARPEATPSGVTVYPEPTAAVLVSTGRSDGVYVNPYSGEVRPLGAQGWRDFFRRMMEWHRWLGAQGENRAVGRAITGASNAAFLFLAVTGLYLWWPRKWAWRAVRNVLWFRRGLHGKARDFNWHNTIGFWSLTVLLVLTVSGLVMSYGWASNLLYTLTGNEPPSNQGPPGAQAVKVPPPPPDAKPLAMDALLAQARAQVPAWESISVRLGGGGEGGGRGGEAGARRGEGGGRGGEGGARGGARGPQAVTFSIREPQAWPRFASAQVSLDPFTGQVLRRETFADSNLGRQLRMWMRFLHTGEALGAVGQFVAALASLGGAFLVWTGFALAWRRFFPRRASVPVEAAEARTEPVG